MADEQSHELFVSWGVGGLAHFGEMVVRSRSEEVCPIGGYVDYVTIPGNQPAISENLANYRIPGHSTARRFRGGLVR